MRSLAEDSFRSKNAGSPKTSRFETNGHPHSWFSRVQRHADRAASAGFVLSMTFLATAAIHAFFLSGAAEPLLADARALGDRAAYEAGYRLEDLALSGAINTPEAALMESLRLPYKGSSLFYDAADARARLLKLGWIQSAEIRRILPSRLEVAVSERTPFARWEDGGHTIQAIDRDGRVLGPDLDGRFKALPLFAGEGAPAQAAGFEDALQDRAAIKNRVARADLVAERFWLVELDTGPVLKLPRKVTPLVLDRIESLLANPKISGLGLETIDLRLSNRTILQLAEPTVANRDKVIAALAQGQSPTWPAPRGNKVP